MLTIQQAEIKHQDQDLQKVFFTFQKNVDDWIKEFNARVNDVESAAESFEEFQGNTNHNYELILEIKEKVDDVKEQIQTLKLTQLMIIKKVFAEELAIDGKNKNFLKKFLSDTEETFETE